MGPIKRAVAQLAISLALIVVVVAMFFLIHQVRGK
jgi:hypothetical protein